MNKFHISRIYYLVIFIFGLIPAMVFQFFTKDPGNKYIHIRNFRYGKDPSVIRCNRGDTLHLTFSTEDTGHSFYLEEFDIDAKISPARDMVDVFKTSDPTQDSYQARELVFIAKHPGILNYLVSKSNYRCHVWCGPMHAFESGKLVIMPNTLLIFSLGCIAGILFLWITGIFTNRVSGRDNNSGYNDILKKEGIIKKLLISRWPQIILTIVAMIMIYIVILTSLLGTKMSGRNLGVLLMWAVWLFLLVAILTPFFGRIWCTICPLPFFGDLIQRRSFFNPSAGKTNGYNNRFYGFSLKWPSGLQNNWIKMFFFLILATFSTTMVANPRVSGFAVIMLILVPTIMAIFWELRAFCRYVCPVSVFVGPFSRMSMLALRNRSQQVCDNCKASYCKQGNVKGWACPYSLNTGEIKENTDCGMCFECLRSCTYNNVTLYRRSFASELGNRNYGEAWEAIVVFTLAIIYCILYEGHWPVIRDFVNILDKKNWDLFGIYALVIWTLSLVIVPGIVYFLSFSAVRLSGIKLSVREVFLASSGSLLPIGLMLWIAFVIPMLFVNVTFIIQSISDPFGWGWDFLGTANIPWHQFVPRLIPWLQALLVLSGLILSLRNLNNTWLHEKLASKHLFTITLPIAIFITLTSVLMIFFFTN
ncbi:MAG: 4Fe-4S binding protein [Bacteroidales bacterium]|nr:4Fe-4S binding protein [Bacteroidales bacterium]